MLPLSSSQHSPYAASGLLYAQFSNVPETACQVLSLMSQHAQSVALGLQYAQVSYMTKSG